MIKVQSGNQFFLLAEESFTELNYTHFFQPEFWQNQGRILDSAEGRGTTWFVDSKDWLGVDCALRHYYRGGLFGKVVKDFYFFSTLEETRSFAEFALLDKLHKEGLPVPRPIIARVERIWGGYRADLLSERIQNTENLPTLLQYSYLTLEQWKELGFLIRKLHDLQICHTDLNAHNILSQLTDEGLKFYLIDFDKCGEKTGYFWKQKNLNRFLRSLYKEKEQLLINFEEDDWEAFMLGYIGF